MSFCGSPVVIDRCWVSCVSRKGEPVQLGINNSPWKYEPLSFTVGGLVVGWGWSLEHSGYHLSAPPR